MCDDRTDHDLDVHGLTRRGFGVMAGSIGLAAAWPVNAAAPATAERDVTIKTADGTCDAYFVAPAKGKHPGVLIWPDIFGLRPAMRQMGKRLAESGYAVLVVNQFYRSAKSPIAPEGTAFDAAFRDMVMPMRALLTPAAAMRDAQSFIAFIDSQKETDRKRRIGTAGYCMGGPLVFQTAAAVPARVGAVASFHGGGLATDKPDSPHLLVPKTQASYLIAVADNDDKANPEEKDKLRVAFDSAKRPAEIEVYEGAMHGWCPPDSRAYNAPQAEKAWGRMLVLFGTALA